MIRRAVFVLVLTVIFAIPAFAQVDALAPSARYAGPVPALQTILGHNAGENFTTHAKVEQYVRALDASSDRVRVMQYGSTVEGRPLLLVCISSPANLARLDELRATWNKLADPRATTAAEAAKLATSAPVLVWFTYGVHGNEPSSSEAALQLAYELAASEDPRVAGWLENAVLFIDPVANPDGRERYVNYFRSWSGTRPRADRFSAEHTERWPSGRFNHYLFDLNRDWAWQTQPESQARVKAFRDWSPQVHVDFHEMYIGSTYFFAPHAKPVLESISKNLAKWYDIFGDAVSSAFDRRGFRYFSREGFDLQYPSYGDTWPALNGAVGMTYEQGGGAAGGLIVDLPDAQRTLTLRDRVTHHFTASLATLEAAVANREARLRDFHAFRSAALQVPASAAMRTVYIEPARDTERTRSAINRLLRQGIEVSVSTAEFEASDVTSYWGEKQARRKLPAGTFIVDLAQPLGFLARVLLEKDVAAEQNYFYDVSAWSVPLLAGLDAYTSTQPVRVAAERVTALDAPAGRIEGVEKPVAYVLPAEDSSSIAALAQLLDRGVKAYVTLRPSTISRAKYPTGTVVVPTDVNTNVRAAIADAVKATGAQAIGLSTTRAAEGLDLGSGRVVFLRKPSIAVLTDAPIQPTEYGALWHCLEERYGIPFTPIRAELLRSVDLAKYNVLVLPADSGDGAGYDRLFDKRTADRIASWVRDGGLLVAIRGGAVWASKAKSGLTSTTYRLVRPEEERARLEEERRRKDDTKDREPDSAKAPDKRDPEAELADKLHPYADREKRQREQDIAGALLRSTVDTTHPLAFGLSERLAVQIDTAPVLELSSKGEHAVYFGKDGLRLSGFITPENEKKLVNTAYAVRERVGRGSVVLFADSPVFRGYTDATTRLLLNALFFGNVHDPNLQY